MDNGLFRRPSSIVHRPGIPFPPERLVTHRVSFAPLRLIPTSHFLPLYHDEKTGLSRLLVDAPDPSHGADTLRMSPWTAEDLRAPMRHGIVTDLVALAGLSQRLPQPQSACCPSPGAGHDRRVSRPAACGLPVALPTPRPLENAV